MPAIPGSLHKQEEYPDSQSAIISKQECAWLRLGTEPLKPLTQSPG